MNPSEKALKQPSREEMKNVKGGVFAPDPGSGGLGTYTCNTSSGSYQIVEYQSQALAVCVELCDITCSTPSLTKPLLTGPTPVQY